MAEDDTSREHTATERQRQRFAERGEVPSSRELTVALGLAATLAVLASRGGHTAQVLLVSLGRSLHGVAQGPALWPTSRIAAALWAAVGPIWMVTLLAGIAASVAQKRGRFSLQMPAIKLSRLAPGPRLAQLFLPKAGIVNVAVALVKVLAVGTACVMPVAAALPRLAAHVPASLPAVVGTVGRMLGVIAWRAVMAFAIVGALDYARSAWRLEERMRMSTQEVRDEAKGDSGDSRVRGRRKKMAQALLQQRSLKRVPEATVVVVNPTHYAVALRYDGTQMRAPQVVAKGTDDWADRLRAIARRHAVPIVRQPSLTRSLYRDVEVGAAIPEALYQAVAVVLAHVMRVGRAQA